MPQKNERDKIIQQIVQILYDAGADRWSVQDKGVLLGAIKLQLQESAREGRRK
jgi:hypothetical protein